MIPATVKFRRGAKVVATVATALPGVPVKGQRVTFKDTDREISLTGLVGMVHWKDEDGEVSLEISVNE